MQRELPSQGCDQVGLGNTVHLSMEVLTQHCWPQLQMKDTLHQDLVILDQPQSQVQGLVFMAFNDLNPASQRTFLPVCWVHWR